MKYICPICGYDGLTEPPYSETTGSGSYEICPCCGFEFGLDDYPDKEKGIAKWRRKWIENGCGWHSRVGKPPADWDLTEQLKTLLLLLLDDAGKGCEGQE